MNAFRGAVAVVTGAGSGIGRAMSVELAKRGATVVATDIAAEAAGETARLVEASGGRAESAALDVRDADAVARVAGDAARAHGKLDYMFNNAGVTVVGEERDLSLDDWHHVLDVNLWGVIHGVRAAYPIMLRQKSGHIVNTASVAGLVPSGVGLPYVTSKYAVVGLSHGLRIEGARLGVKVTVVCPGFIDTAILDSPSRAPIPDKVRETLPVKPARPERAAREILDGVAKNEATVVVTAHAKALVALERVSTNAAIATATRFLDQMRKRRTGAR